MHKENEEVEDDIVDKKDEDEEAYKVKSARAASRRQSSFESLRPETAKAGQTAWSSTAETAWSGSSWYTGIQTAARKQR